MCRNMIQPGVRWSAATSEFQSCSWRRYPKHEPCVFVFLRRMERKCAMAELLGGSPSLLTSSAPVAVQREVNVSLRDDVDVDQAGCDEVGSAWRQRACVTALEISRESRLHSI
jgi:hypothetical protein